MREPERSWSKAEQRPDLWQGRQEAELEDVGVVPMLGGEENCARRGQLIKK